ncbi:hypothetical protein [Streptomyces sp. NPDC007206]
MMRSGLDVSVLVPGPNSRSVRSLEEIRPKGVRTLATWESTARCAAR